MNNLSSNNSLFSDDEDDVYQDHVKEISYNDLDDVRTICYENFRECLGGIWNQISENQILIERLSGGFSNYLFVCSIKNQNSKIREPVPTKVVLRIYGESHNNNDSTLKEIITSVIISCKGTGPKILGVLPFGRIEEYLDSSPCSPTDFYDSKMNRLIANRLSEFHGLISDMPFNKEPKWFFDSINKNLKLIETRIRFEDENDVMKFDKFKNYNLREEFKNLTKMIKTVNSPIVFSHNDFQPGNLLKLANDDQIILIDYEYANYNFRGFDIGNIFCECMMINNYDKYPYFKCDYSLYPNREQQLKFIRSYLGMDINENEEDIYLREANTFALASHFFWALWSVCHTPSSIFFSNLDYALARMDIYEKQKKLIEYGV